MSNVLDLFSKTTGKWFKENVGTPTKVQKEGWPAIAKGGHVLISAPTGTGKTLSAFLIFIDKLRTLSIKNELEDKLYYIYISPLKALGNDIRENLKRPLEGIMSADADINEIKNNNLNIKPIITAIRTGDTTSNERQRMIRKPPHILITTPESLYLLITSKSGKKMLSTAQGIILDELHAIIDSKRGAHLMLSLARLDKLCGRKLQRIGLSATIEPLKLAADYLASYEPVEIIAPKIEKTTEIEVTSAVPDMHVLPEGTIWPEIARVIYEQCENARTVIAFVDGRAYAEKLAYNVNQIAGEGYARTHHGCISKEQRYEAEKQLKAGKLKLLCATSSMELGIDVGEIDIVIQIGSPKSISGTLQRLGRAGHNPGRTSVMHLFPRTMGETLTCGLTAKVASEGRIEKSKPPMKCLDVLSQHLVSMSAGEEYTVDEALELLKNAYNFTTVTKREMCNVLKMLAGDYEHELDRPARPRLLYDRIHETVTGDTYSRMLAVSSGGTIPDQGWFSVNMPDGTKLGELDEEFVFESRVGDKFLLGAFAWKITELTKDKVYVKPTNTEGAQSPFWKSAKYGREYQTGIYFGRIMRLFQEAYENKTLYNALRENNMNNAAANIAEEYISLQIESAGCLSDDKTIVVEHFSDEAGENHMMVHCIFGRAVNTGIGLMMKERLEQITGMQVSCYEDDDGFMLSPYGCKDELPDGVLQKLEADKIKDFLYTIIPRTSAFNISFRHNSSRSLMMGVRRGKRQPLWLQRLKSAEVMGDAIAQEGHPLIEETKRDCLDNYLDVTSSEKVLKDIQAGNIKIREIHLQAPSIMSLPLRRQMEATMVYDYTPVPSKVIRSIDQAMMIKDMIQPAKEQLERFDSGTRQPKDMNQLHSLMMAEGDIVAGETDAPAEWLETLARQERLCYIEPGLWICAEHIEQYNTAMNETAETDIAQRHEIRKRIIRRCIRYRGAQNKETLNDRYFWGEDECINILKELEESGNAVESGGYFYHSDIYSRAQRETVAMKRKMVATMPPERYQAMLCKRMRIPGIPQEQLEYAIKQLAGMDVSPELWEGVLLPARMSGYKAALLDNMLTEGEYFWKLNTEKKPLLGFYKYEDIDWDKEIPLLSAKDLSEDEKIITEALEKRGATFAQRFSTMIGGRSPIEALYSLAEKGYVKADSFAPVRQWINRLKTEKYDVKQRAKVNVMNLTAGRWELIRTLKERTAEEHLNSIFDKCVLLSRETVYGISWAQALEILRIWEYTGQVRRGYFIEGMSGAQFIREQDYNNAILAMENPGEELMWVNAADPVQQWGKSVKHKTQEESFMCISSTAVCLRGGKPVAVLERNGGTLKVFDGEFLNEAVKTFVREYKLKHIFPDRKNIVIKEYPMSAQEALKGGGFVRQMLEYIIWKN